VDRDLRLRAAADERPRGCVAEAGRQHDRGANLAFARLGDRGRLVEQLDLEGRVGLASRSTTAIGIRDGLPSSPPPKSDPKNAAMTIGATIDMTSARRFEK